jgi:histidine ammonia-lyase
MLIRANTLAIGLSGVRPILAETLLEMLNRNVTPVIPSQGSLGSSGDLSPLSHLALVFTTDEADRDEDSGKAFFDGQITSGKSAMQAAGIERLVLGPKEALGITNGATFSAGIAALSLHAARRLLTLADLAAAMSLEALLGASAAFDARIHENRFQSGQIEVAAHIRKLTQASTLVDAAGRVQDSYSLRCAPQVHGPALEAIEFAKGVIEREMNAVTDNPLIFSEEEALSGGNFHGEPVGMVMDFTKIAMAEIGAISERRTFHLTDGKMNAGLPPMLVDSPEAAGIHSGMMMPQYTAASLVLENQALANPNTIHSLPTSGGKEDHNANAMTAARNARQVVENVAHILAIEIYVAARALDLRLRQMPDAKLGEGVQIAHQKLRERIPYRPDDSFWGAEIEQVKGLIQREDFLNALA